jgi:hypothetical protein
VVVSLHRLVVWTLFVLALIACGHTRDLGDLPLQRPDESAQLQIIGDDGNALTAFGSGYLAIPGVVIANDTLSLHPGRHRIAYGCPQPPDVVILNDAAPSVEFDFLKGRRYTLRCVDGTLVIEDIHRN